MALGRLCQLLAKLDARHSRKIVLKPSGQFEELPTQSLLRDFCDSELRSVFKDFRKAGTWAMVSRL